MALRPFELRDVAAALERELAGAVVQKIWTPWSERLELELRQPGRTTRLRISVEGQGGRLSIIDARTVTAEKPSPWLLRLRKELVGRRVAHLRTPGARELRLELVRPGSPARAVVAELGAPGALLLLGEADHPLAAAEGRARPPRPPSSFPDDAPPSRLPPVEGLALGRAAEELLGAKEEAAHRAAARRARLQPLRARVQRLVRTREKVRAEAARDAEAEEHRRLGELLRHHHSEIPRGATTVRLTEWTEAGARQVDVPLDPALAPRAQVDRHFHLYRRLSRGSALARERLAQLDREVLAAEQALGEAEATGGGEPESAEPRPIPSRRKAPAVHRPYRVFHSADGHPIWVGRAGADNDALTFQIARPHHLWLHARGLPGAHVVVPLDRKEEVPPEVLLDAAHLALHHARGGEGSRGEVAWTRARLVRRVKGGAPGQVTYSGEKVLSIRVEPSRLERLQRARDVEASPPRGRRRGGL
jgi:predicted ribosome quality control (RQC) complex YloA/Tae2 family protein